MKFTELPLSESYIKDLEENGFVECTQVQELAIPHILQKKNLMIQAQTGTGKTATFLIPLMEKYIQDKKQGITPPEKPTALIVSPTRELANQIMEDALILGAESFGIPGVTLYGGGSINTQKKSLSQAQFIIATPGRLLDMCSQVKGLLSQINYFVLDEADRLFDMGFYPDLQKIISSLPPKETRLNMLFSATLPPKVKNIAKYDFTDPVEIDVHSKNLAVDKIRQEVVHLLHSEKLSVVLGLLKSLEPTETAMVFVNTKRQAEELAHRLVYNNISCDYIIGDLPQARRQKVIQKIKEGDIPVLIATDVAARGIHIHDLHLVINYDIPEDPQNYIHRIGRTGRAGKHGRAIALACDRDVYNLDPIEKLLTHKIPPMEDDYTTFLEKDESEEITVRELLNNSHKKLGRPFLLKATNRSLSSRSGGQNNSENTRGRRDARGGRSRDGNRDSRGTRGTRNDRSSPYKKRSDDRGFDDRRSGDGRSRDRKFDDRRSGDGRSRDRKFDDRRSEDGRSRDRKFDDRRSGDGRSRDRKFDDRRSGDGRSRDRKFDDRRSGDGRSRDRKFDEKKSGKYQKDSQHSHGNKHKKRSDHDSHTRYEAKNKKSFDGDSTKKRKGDSTPKNLDSITSRGMERIKKTSSSPSATKKKSRISKAISKIGKILDTSKKKKGPSN